VCGAKCKLTEDNIQQRGVCEFILEQLAKVKRSFTHQSPSTGNETNTIKNIKSD